MVITLLTDFGLRDEYVGVMKGVILGIDPKAAIVDLCHEIPPGDVEMASWLLDFSWRFFPKGTVHVVVVDPGVGSPRKILCLELKGHRFLAPDNGVVSQVVKGIRNPSVYAVTNRRYALKKISHTFHGRDIFAPAAAYLSKGVPASRLGPRWQALKRLPTREPSPVGGKGWHGQVIGFDRFGNAVTNLPEMLLKRLGNLERLKIKAKGCSLEGIQHSYPSVAEGVPLAVMGSRGLLEISVNQGSAHRHLRLKKGDRIEVRA